MRTVINPGNNPVPPYISKKFKLIPILTTENNLVVDYVDKLSSAEKADVEFIISTELKFRRQIDEKMFLTALTRLYPDISSTDTVVVEETKKSTPIVYDVEKLSDPEPEIMNVEDFIKQLPIEKLESELRGRYLSTPLFGSLLNSKEGIKFGIEEMKWPEGSFRVKIEFLEDTTEQYLKDLKSQEQATKLNKQVKS